MEIIKYLKKELNNVVHLGHVMAPVVVHIHGLGTIVRYAMESKN